MAQLIHGTTINGHIAIHAGNMSDHSIATTSYVTTQINNLINGAPGALDTLNELAAALGNDASFSSTLTNSLAAKLSLSGGTLTGKVLFPSAVSNRPQFPGGILGLDTGDGNFDIWGISRDYYPSHSNASNAWGLRWNGDNNDFEFVGGGSNRVVLDMDGGNLTASGIVYASGGNSGNWNTAYGWGNHAVAGYLTSYTETNTFLGDGGSGATHPGTDRLIFTGQISAGADVLGMPTNDNSNAFLNINRHPGEYNSQLGFSSNGNMYYRSFSNTAINSTQGWRQVWDSGNLTNLNQLTNGPSYITGITSGMVTTALGYTPANSSHNHDGVYLPIGGGSATGWVSFSSSTQGTPIIKAIQQDTTSGFYLFQGITGSTEVFRVERTGNIVTSGTISASGYNAANWNTAYGWGNHASAGYQAASTAITTSNIGSQSVSYASQVGINYNNNSNSTYQILWGSGNSVYGTGGVYLNPYTDYVYATSFVASDWIRTSGSTGWYSETYGGGWYMTDSSYLRPYNGKSISMGNASVDYVNQLHFNDNVRFYQNGDDRYLNFKWGNSGAGGIQFIDGDGSRQGYVYGSGTGSFGLLDGSGNWKVRLDTSDVEMYGTQYLTTVYANIIYDRDNSSYYVNPASSSRLYLLGLGGAAPDAALSVSGTAHVDGTLFLGGTAGTVNSWGTRTTGTSGYWRNSSRDVNFNNEGYGTTWTFAISSAGAVTLNRHIDANTTWGSGGTTIFMGWYGGKIMLGNNGDGAHDWASAIGGNSIISTNKHHFYKGAYMKNNVDGAEVLAIDGVNGRLFTVTDSVLDTIYSVNTVAGLPILEIMSNSTVKIGKYGANSITISNSRIAINSDTVDTNFPFYVSDRSTSASRYILANPGMGFNLADSYAQLQLYGTSGAYIDFVTGANDYNGRIIWASSKFTISGAMWGDMYNTSGAAYATQAWVQAQGYRTTDSDSQTLSVSGSTLTISGGNSVTLPTGGITAETDTLATVTGRGASTASQVSFTKTDDHAISVGTIRGRAVGSQGGEFIQLYERVNIGGPSGWGAANTAAPTYGLSVYGGANIGYGNSASLYAYAYRGNSNVSGTGEASHHPAGIYSTGTNWLYGTMYLNGNDMYDINGIRAYYYYDRSDTAYYVRPSGNSNLALLRTEGISDGTYTRIVNPNGAKYVTTTSTVSGAIKIKMPVLGSGMMMMATANIYEYATGQSFQITFGGHRDGNGWYNIFAYQLGDIRGDLTVRFGNDAGGNCVWIGETGSSWSYPQVWITDVQLGYTGYSATWMSGWSISFASAFDTVTHTRTAYRKLDSGNYNSYSPTLTGGGASGTWSINVTGSAGSVAWGNVSSRPTALSQFSNDLGNYGGWITSSGSISGTAARATRANGNFYIDDNYGNTVVGVYSSTRFQGVYAMGDSYKISADGTSLSSLYGLAWTHSNVGGQGSYVSGHQLLIVSNGSTQTAISADIWARGNISANGGVYDSGSRVAISRGEGRNYVDYSRYVYNNNAYSGSGWVEPSDLGVRYANSAGSLSNMNISQFSNNSGYITSSASISGNSNGVAITGFGSGNFSFYQDSGTFGPFSGWHNYFIGNHGNGSNYYNTTIAMPFWGVPKYARLEGGTQRGPWEFITGENIASQSVSNSDTVDGYHASNFLGKNGNSYYQADTWIQLNGAHGLYSPSYNGAHWFPNTSSTYGTWGNSGSRNSYDGIYSSYSGVNWAMYDSAGNGGVYREGNGRWFWYHHVGNNCTGISTSTTSSSYRAYIGGSLYAEGDIVAYSDARKKTDIVTIDNALDKVLQLRGVYYTRIDETEKGRQTGVIAQEINEVLPEVVTYAQDVDEYGVKYGNIAGILIEAVKEQQKQIAELKEEIKKLRSE